MILRPATQTRRAAGAKPPSLAAFTRAVLAFGFFGFSLIIALAWFFTNPAHYNFDTYELNLQTANAGTLVPARSEVRLSGVKIGWVDRLIWNEIQNRIQIKVKIERQFDIGANSAFAVLPEGLLGDQVVNVTPGHMGSRLLVDAETVPCLEPVSFSDMGRRINEALHRYRKSTNQWAPESIEKIPLVSSQSIAAISGMISHWSSPTGAFHQAEQWLAWPDAHGSNLTAAINGLPKTVVSLSNQLAGGQWERIDQPVGGASNLALSILETTRKVAASEALRTLACDITNRQQWEDRLRSSVAGVENFLAGRQKPKSECKDCHGR